MPPLVRGHADGLAVLVADVAVLQPAVAVLQPAVESQSAGGAAAGAFPLGFLVGGGNGPGPDVPVRLSFLASRPGPLSLSVRVAKVLAGASAGWHLRRPGCD